MRIRRTITVASVIFVFLSIAAILYLELKEPWTSAYEINPLTLELRKVVYIQRPISGLAEHRVLGTKEMAIGRWLKNNGYLKDTDISGYWVLVKSYNRRWGFKKGIGRSLYSLFDKAGILTPMPYPAVDGTNQRWIDWCTTNPERAKWAWSKYSELAANPNHVYCAADLLWGALHYSDRDGYDFETAMQLRMQNYNLSE